MTNGEITNNNGSGPEDQVRTGLEIIAAQNVEGQNGHHPLEIVTAVIGLTQEVNKATARRAIDIAKGMGLTEIDELDRLVEASSRVQVIDSPNGHHETAVVPVELEDRVGDEGAADGDAQEQSDGSGADGMSESSGQEPEEKNESAVKAEKHEGIETDATADPGNAQYSKHFDLPSTRTKAGKPTFKGSMQEVIVGFFDEQQATQDEDQFYSLEETSGKGAINKLILLIEDKLEEREIVMDHSKRQLFNQVVYTLRDRGYLVLETPTGGRVCSGISIGKISQENLKKN